MAFLSILTSLTVTLSGPPHGCKRHGLILFTASNIPICFHGPLLLEPFPVDGLEPFPCPDGLSGVPHLGYRGQWCSELRGCRYLRRAPTVREYLSFRASSFCIPDSSDRLPLWFHVLKPKCSISIHLSPSDYAGLPRPPTFSLPKEQ